MNAPGRCILDEGISATGDIDLGSIELWLLGGCLLAAIAPRLSRISSFPTGYLIAAFCAGFAAYLASSPIGTSFELPWLVRPEVEGAFVYHALWVDISVGFEVTHIGRLYGVLIAALGIAIFSFAQVSQKSDQNRGRFFGVLTLFTVAMLSLVLASNVFTLWFAWEVTSFTSYFLIGHDTTNPKAKRSAQMALLLTGGTGLLLLAGMIGLNRGSVDSMPELSSTSWPFLIPVLIACFAKSAQFPFQFWLPNAMTAPTPVSAYLHSATMVQAGVFLIASLRGRAEVPWLGEVLVIVGSATLLFSALQSLSQKEFKRVLAVSTYGSLGLMLILVGIGTPMAMTAMFLYVVVHALYKCSMFLIAGVAEYSTGSKEFDQLRGLTKSMPAIGVAAACAVATMIGLFPTTGFIAKEAVLGAVSFSPVLVVVLFVGVTGMAAIAWQFFSPFLPSVERSEAKPAPIVQALVILPLVVVAAFGAILWFVAPQLIPAITERSASETPLWHGFTPVFFVSTAALILGVGIGMWRVRRTALPDVGVAYEKAVYDAPLKTFRWVAERLPLIVHHGHLRMGLASLLGCAAVLTTIHLVIPSEWSVNWSQTRVFPLIIAGLLLVLVLAVLSSRSRLSIITLLGGIGVCVTLLFVLFGGPDLALTQIVTDTLTVLIFVFVFHHLPKFTRLSTPWERIRDAVIASSLGVGLMFAMMVLVPGKPSPIWSEVAKRSLSEAHGRNLVNTIIVDFRGLDTLGEITVLGLAGLGVATLLRHRLRPSEMIQEAPE